jgi:hypothetical protein
MRQLIMGRGPADCSHWPGESDLMGDVPSRSFEEGFPVNHDEEFFIFTHLFPLPHHFPHTGPGQPTCWRHVTTLSRVTSAVISLLRKVPDMSPDPTVVIGGSGCNIPHLVTKTLTSYTCKERPAVWNEASCSCQQGRLHSGRAPLGASIETTLREVACFLDSRGIGDPRRSTLGQPFLNTQFSDIMKRWKLEDPVARPQQVLPSSTVRVIAKTYGALQNPRNCTMGDLVVTAYFFLLCMGEYTLTCLRKGRRQLTIPLRKRDIMFRKEGKCVPDDSPLDTLATVDMVTEKLGNQRTGARTPR